MSGIDITITLDNADLDAALTRAIAGAEDMRAPLFSIASQWKMLVGQRFDDEVSPLGVPWAKRRDNADPGRPILYKDGHLRGGVIEDFGADYAQIGVEATGGPAKYARIHNEGGTIVPRTGKALSFGGRIVAKVVMPKRQFLGFGPKEQAVVDDVLGDWVRGLFSGGESVEA